MPDENPFDQKDVAPPVPLVAPAEVKAKEEEEKKARQGLPSNVIVQEANAPMTLDATKRVDPNNKYIEYIGIGTVRHMTALDWANQGVDDFDQFVEWNYLNNKRVPMSLFSDKALAYLLRRDGRFKLVEVDSEEK